MKNTTLPDAPAAGRLSRAARRAQMLDIALEIIREEGADRLTLGYLAARAGVSKPVAYEHFGTRSGLLTAMYRALDEKHSVVLRDALSKAPKSLQATADVLASAWVHCSADSSGEWHAIGSALGGSEEMVAVHKELIEEYVRLFAATLKPWSTLADDELYRRCAGLIGAGDALSMLMINGQCSEQDAAQSFSALIQGGVGAG